MTYAPVSILEVRRLLKGQDMDLSDAEVGIVGGPSHVRQGTSYHLGADQLQMWKNPYSARTPRDLAGLSNAASAIDIDDDLDELRSLSVWLVEQCRAGAPDTLDIREVIYSPDGVNVLRWDQTRGQGSAPFPDSDLSHRTHTHISWYRDSESRRKTGPFQRFFGGEGMAPTDEEYLIRRVEALALLLKNFGASDDPNYTEEGTPVPLTAAITAITGKLNQLLAMPPGAVDYDKIRAMIREELDATRLGPTV